MSKSKNDTLGMPHGTAAHKLRKLILFDLLVKSLKAHCFKCASPIESADDLSIEHVLPWEGRENGKELFFDLNNIMFSHLKCNRPHIYRGAQPSRNVVEGQRFCTHCKTYKHEDDFFNNKNTWHGKSWQCKECKGKNPKL